MKSHRCFSKTARTASADSTQHSSAGESAAAIAPPDYGIGFVDNGMAATAPVQRMGKPEEEELLQGKLRPVQRHAMQVEDLVRAKSATGEAPAQLQGADCAQANNTGLPDALKAGIESLAGYSMDDVKVHYNSDKPAQLHAHAYAQGTDIHVARGQEKHLPHEAWHVVQQRQGRVAATRQAKGLAVNDSPALEREADMMGTASLARGSALSNASRDHSLPAVYGLAPGLARGRRAALPVAQCTYAALNPVNRARVDALADRDYADKAADFEQRLGRHLAEAAEPLVAVNAMLDRVKAIVDAWAEHTGQAKLQVYANEFAYAEGDKYYGAFMMTGAAIKKVFDSRNFFGKAQPARKKLKIVYNAVRNNNLAKWLKVAADELDERQAAAVAVRAQAPVKVVRTVGAFHAPNSLVGATFERVGPGFAAASGLEAALGNPVRAAAVRAASAREKLPFLGPGGVGVENLHVSAPDRFSGLARGTAHEAAQIDVANRDRLYNQNVGVDYADQHTVAVGDLPDLTADEIRLLRARGIGVDPGPIDRRAKRRFKAHAADKIPWEQGRDAIAVMLNSQVHRDAEAIGARLEAGVSGSTGMMYAAAKNLGLDNAPTLRRLRLAMLGWMLPNHDHSFYEIMRAAEIQGVPFTINLAQPGLQYEAPGNYLPMPVAGFQNLLPERQFPRFFLGGGYKDNLSGHLAGTSTLIGMRTIAVTRGLDQATADALDARALAEINLLNPESGRTNFRPPGRRAVAAANLAANRLQRRHLRERPSYRYLARRYPVHAELWFGLLMAHARKPLDDDNVLLNRAGSAALTALTDGPAAMRAVLTGAGLPTELVQPMSEHVLHDLMQLRAMIGQLPFNPALPWSNAANQGAVGRLDALPQVVRVRQVLGAVGDLAIGRLLGQRHGAAFERAFHGPPDTDPSYVQLLGQGLPNALAGRIVAHPHAAAIVAHVNQLVIDIGNAALLAAPLRLAAVVQVPVTHAAWKLWFDTAFGAPRYDLVVAALADRAHIDLAANPNLKALAGAASALNTALPIDMVAIGNAGFQAAGLGNAAATLTANLHTQGLLVAATPFAALSPVEVAAINAYSRLGGMGAWQAALSGLDTSNRVAADRLPKLAPRIQAAVSGLRRLPVAPGPVYSAARTDLAGNPAAAMQQYRPGQIVPYDNFLSSAKSINASFIPNAGYGIAFEILGLRSGRDIMMISTNRDEEEVLFPPGARFKVVSVTDRSAALGGHGKVWVRMVEL